jgi:hypothetical protein
MVRGDFPLLRTQIPAYFAMLPKRRCCLTRQNFGDTDEEVKFMMLMALACAALPSLAFLRDGADESC